MDTGINEECNVTDDACVLLLPNNCVQEEEWVDGSFNRSWNVKSKSHLQYVSAVEHTTERNAYCNKMMSIV
jgi:hypothetical protein